MLVSKMRPQNNGHVDRVQNCLACLGHVSLLFGIFDLISGLTTLAIVCLFNEARGFVTNRWLINSGVILLYVSAILIIVGGIACGIARLLTNRQSKDKTYEKSIISGSRYGSIMGVPATLSSNIQFNLAHTSSQNIHEQLKTTAVIIHP